MYACINGMVWYGMVWYGMVWLLLYGMVWYGIYMNLYQEVGKQRNK